MAIGAAGYPSLLRGRVRNWGATPDDVAREMPGDDLLPDPHVLTTRAIHVDAPAGAVWPWLVQMGAGRAGAYTYDWIENLLGLDMHSADEILPEFQHLHVGDELPISPKGVVLRVEVLDAERAMVLRSDDHHWVWAFGLTPEGSGTRLVSRNRIDLSESSAPGRVAYIAAMEPGSLVMERKMLIGIADRAERRGLVEVS